jgi:hypothetical protein
MACARWGTPRPRKRGFVYFIRAGRTNAVKIGWAGNPEIRIRASPHPLYMIGHMPGTMFDEADWHSRFEAERIRGEWFTLSERLRIAINGLSVSDCGFVQYLSLSILTRNAK